MLLTDRYELHRERSELMLESMSDTRCWGGEGNEGGAIALTEVITGMQCLAWYASWKQGCFEPES